jgi:UDP-N-acetylmuramate dehydrogenase
MNTIMPSTVQSQHSEDLIQENVSLADKNWFKTGGSARFFATPTTSHEFTKALHFANNNQLPIFILGHGANILISDYGFNGLVMQTQLKEITILNHDDNDFSLVKAGSGVSIPDLIVFCLEHNLSGLEEFSGIPGTVGGSVYINLHYFQYLLSDFLIEAEVVEKTSGSLQTVSNSWFNFGYNLSKLQEENHYVMSATFKLKKVTDLQKAYAQGRSIEIIRHRATRYPARNTCGSFFRNFHDDEVTLMSNGKKLIYVAYYLDKIGVKGALTHGDAIVSYQHANMIVNKGNATSGDIIEVARTMQKLVFENFNIVPQPECRLIGFKEYPLF